MHKRRLSVGCMVVAFGVLAGFCGSARAFEPIKPMPAPGDLPDFQQAEDLYNRSMSGISGETKLGFHYYLKAVAGYRLAQYWARQGRANSPDAKFGYTNAKANLPKAKATLTAEKAAYERMNNQVGKQFCEKMLEFVQKLDAQIDKETKR